MAGACKRENQEHWHEESCPPYRKHMYNVFEAQMPLNLSDCACCTGALENKVSCNSYNSLMFECVDPTFV